MTHHQIRGAERERYLAELREIVAGKRRLEPVYLVVHLDAPLAGVLPEFLNAFVFKELLNRYPELVDHLLLVRESLFTLRPNDHRFPSMGGETVFALRAWDAEVLRRTLADAREYRGAGFEILRVVEPEEGFTPGAFSRMRLDVFLPEGFFPEPRGQLERYLRGVYVPYSLRREGDGYRFDLPRKALKKKVLFAGFFEVREDGFFASLDVGPKFDLMALLQSFGGEGLPRHAQVQVLEIEW
jgi:hypothetical protein